MTDNDIFIKDWFWAKISASTQKNAHIIMIATKPDIIKQAPLYLELKQRWELVVLIHTWQHYDYNLSEWVLKEFGMEVDVNLNIFGSIHKKYSLIVERLGDFLIELKDNYNKLPIPYVHWDTLTATTADKAAFLNKIAVVHVEAWIRTFTPKKEFYHKLFNNYKAWSFDFEKYLKDLQNKDNFELWSIEPFPEQFDTRWIEGSTWYYALPCEIYRETLTNEWFDTNKMEVVGNTVVDAIRISQGKIAESKAFEIYPNMKWKKFIFVTIHRRENCENKDRFIVLFYALKKLITSWVNVCFLELNASKTAIANYWLQEELNELIKNYPENFAYWPALAHHNEVIDMLTNAWAVVTDSGSMQEEANIVWTPCVTLRFWSDRTETIWAGCNVIAPPTNSNLIAEIVENTLNHDFGKIQNLYGENVSEKIVDWVLKKLETQNTLFQLDDERLDLLQFIDSKI